MPLLVVSPNLPDAADSPSRKRSHEDFLGSESKGDAARKPSGGSLPLISDIENRNTHDETHQQENQQQQGQTPSREESPDILSSPLSCSPLSLLTDAGSSSLTRVSPSPNTTPGRPSGPLPELVITLDAMPASRIPPNNGDDTSAASSRDAQQPPPPKRKRLTAAEREEKAKADAARKLEKERQEAARKQEKERLEAAKKQERDEKMAAAEAKKKALADEREKKRRQREEEEQRRAERNEEKEKRRREKEDEERRIQEAKQKKERSQLRLNSFFRLGTTSSGTAAAAAGTTTATAAAGGGATGSSPQPKGTSAANGNGRLASASPQKAAALSGSGSAAGAAAPQLSEYDRIFKPFFVKENVVMATSLFGLDDAARAAKAQSLEEHLAGSREPAEPPRPFSHTAAVDYFQLPCCPCSQAQYKKAHARGRVRPTVRKIMDMLGDSAYGGGAAQQAQTAAALDLLRSVPMKYLAFREDVRPPYYGTVTSVPPQARLAKLARNPLAKTVLPLSYDYDSEAEWVDDGDGEDVDDLDDDEELEPEEDEEMADFLDDSEDNGLAPPRPAFSGGMEPESTGLCWENEQNKGPLAEMESYRMELILNHDGPIDPLSTQYWEPPQPAAVEKPSADAGPSTAGAKKASMRPPPTPSDAFVALLGARSNGQDDSPSDAATASPAAKAAAGSASATKAAGSTSSAGAGGGSASGGDAGSSSSSKKAAVGVAEEHVADLKKAVLQYAKLSKLGLVEMLSVEFLGKCTKSQIKVSLEALAERTGPGQHKTWKLKE